MQGINFSKQEMFIEDKASNKYWHTTVERPETVSWWQITAEVQRPFHKSDTYWIY